MNEDLGDLRVERVQYEGTERPVRTLKKGRPVQA